MTESVLKVGDKRKWKESKRIFLVVAMSKAIVIYECEGAEYTASIDWILEQSAPYQEPAPARKLVGHIEDNGYVCLSLVNSEVCKLRDLDKALKRIELTKELFGWGE